MRAIACLVLVALTTLSGCASIVSGQNQSVSVVAKDQMNDVSGAKCSLVNDKGTWYATTPGSVTVRRSFNDLSVNCSHDGTAPGATSVKSTTKGMAFGNILFGGLIGAGVDISTGAAYDYPEVIVVKMGQVMGVDIDKPLPAATPAATDPSAAPKAVKVVATAVAPAGGNAGQDGFEAQKFARSLSCNSAAAPTLVSKGPGFETYSVACDGGDSKMLRCELGTCRELK